MRGNLTFTPNTVVSLAKFDRAVVDVTERGVTVAGTNDPSLGSKLSRRAGRSAVTLTLPKAAMEALGEPGSVAFEMTLKKVEDGGRVYRLKPGGSHAVVRPKA